MLVSGAALQWRGKCFSWSSAALQGGRIKEGKSHISEAWGKTERWERRAGLALRAVPLRVALLETSFQNRQERTGSLAQREKFTVKSVLEISIQGCLSPFLLHFLPTQPLLRTRSQVTMSTPPGLPAQIQMAGAGCIILLAVGSNQIFSRRDLN